MAQGSAGGFGTEGAARGGSRLCGPLASQLRPTTHFGFKCSKFHEKTQQRPSAPPPVERQPGETPEAPVPCCRTQLGDTGEGPKVGMSPRTGGALHLPQHPCSGLGPRVLAEGTPTSRDINTPPPAAHFRGWARGEAPAGRRLTQAVGRGQQQDEQREHGASAWVPRAECGRRVGDARVVPAGPACGLQPPTFLHQPRPRGKQVGPVSPGSICYAWAPAGRRAENGHTRGRGVPQPAPQGGTRLDPQPQRPHQGPPLSGSGTPPSPSRCGRLVNKAPSWCASSVRPAEGRAASRRGRTRRGGRAMSLLGSARTARPRGRAALCRPAAPAAGGLGQGGRDVVGPVGPLGEGSPEILAAQESPHLGAAGRQAEASSRVPTALLAPSPG